MVTLFLCGDVMTGRGIDQILRHSCAPGLYEPLVKNAHEYVAMAEATSGAIPTKVPPTYPWGIALEELEHRRPDARIINLETSVTTSEDAEPKGINYRMHPANVDVLSAAGIDCVALANNHVLDWSDAGLFETLDTLCGAAIRATGVGRTIDEAQRPAIVAIGDTTRVVVVAVSGNDSGVPRSWSATTIRPGVFRIDDYSPANVDRIARLIEPIKRPGDIAVLSIHWGGNWGYEVPDTHRQFAHALIERAAVDIVHGHSSHHAKGVELYRHRPILYGCGDFLNDYEGIHGPEGFRDDLTFMYFASVDQSTGELRRLELVPLRIHKFQLQRPSREDRTWLRGVMARECSRLGGRITARDGVVGLEPT